MAMIYLQENQPLPSRLVIDASAGTGKTWHVVAIVTRELALRTDLRIDHVLITTYTRNAAAELRERLRRRLIDTAHALRQRIALNTLHVRDADPLLNLLSDGDINEVAMRARRLEQAICDFDAAIISTIHGVCASILKTAGVSIRVNPDTKESDRVIDEAINDFLLIEAQQGRYWNQPGFSTVVKQLAKDPLLEPWYDAQAYHGNEPVAEELEQLKTALENCRDRIFASMTNAVGYDELLRLAWELVRSESQEELLRVIQERYKLAIIDEAQDTAPLQWQFFEKLFPGNDGRTLVTVGDPKQAIYSFTGADVRAYVHFTQSVQSRETLDVNRRSDQPLLDELNRALENSKFGEGISYVPVEAPEKRKASLIDNIQGPVEYIDIGDATNQQHLIRPVVNKVAELYSKAKLKSQPSDKEPVLRPLRFSDICILVRSNSAGQSIQRGLIRNGIPAVAGGTSNVMNSPMGSDIRSLLEALERPSNLGRVRQLAATIFFGKSVVHAGSLADESIYQIQDQLQVLADVMLKKGLAAFAANIESNAEIMSRMVAGNHGERNITDFAHVMELMASLSTGRGCTPSKALEIFNELIEIDDNNELVSRRVESDADAVKVLTIHAAKGLQFPCVIVADLWKPVVNRSSKGTIFYDEDRTRKIEIINAMPEERDLKRSQAVARLLNDEILQETKRLLYVALTRPQHYLGILRTQASSILQESIQLPDARAPLNEPPEIQLEGGEPMVELQLATFPAVTRTWMRTSFSGIASVHRSKDNNHFGSPANGFDEQKDQFDESDESNDDETFSQPHSSDNLPASAAFGSIIHEILENTDPSVHPLQEEIQRVVNDRVVSNQLRHLRDDICTMLSDAMTTPFGHPLGELSLSSFSKADRLVEVDFDLGLASLTRGICVRDIGCTLVEMLDDHDPLWEYSHFLVNSDSRILIGGLLTGSIDAVLRMPNCANGKTQFIICDYKSNRLPAETSGNSLHAYAPDRLWIAMKHHHYPLQALLYGTALFRMLRWRAPDLDPDEAITGIVYAFLRGMRGSTTPVDKNGRRFGVVTWRAPAGLWKKLSDVLAGNKGTGN